MAATTGIDWTDATWNPLNWHCTPVSTECDNCYAATWSARWRGPADFTAGPPSIVPGRMLLPWQDKTIRDDVHKMFLTSMSDPFHGRLPIREQAFLWSGMAAVHDKVHQVLTKRDGIMRSRVNSPKFANLAYWQLDRLEAMARNARRLTPWRIKAIADIDLARRTWQWPLRNVWLGVSAGTQATADRRIERLADTMAATRIISCEPLLERVDITEWIEDERPVNNPDDDTEGDAMDAPDGALVDGMRRSGSTWIREEHLIHQVIVGGESGGRHRPLDVEHARQLRDQCTRYGVPFWFKQVGGPSPTSGGDLLDGRRWKQWPVQRPGVLV